MIATTTQDFRRIALSLEGVEEYSHAGFPAFHVGGRKFASLASQTEGYGNLMLTLEQQGAFVRAAEVFATTVKRWSQGKNINQKITYVYRSGPNYGQTFP